MTMRLSASESRHCVSGGINIAHMPDRNGIYPMTSFDITHFNSGTQKEGDFLRNFIARNDVLQFFLAQLRSTQAGQSAKHHLIIAPRGYGKTSLLRRIKI